jgi:hypothetical protein
VAEVALPIIRDVIGAEAASKMRIADPDDFPADYLVIEVPASSVADRGLPDGWQGDVNLRLSHALRALGETRDTRLRLDGR